MKHKVKFDPKGHKVTFDYNSTFKLKRFRLKETMYCLYNGEVQPSVVTMGGRKQTVCKCSDGMEQVHDNANFNKTFFRDEEYAEWMKKCPLGAGLLQRCTMMREFFDSKQV